ncbi:MAG TPA: hypothetical protein VGQ55_07415 [Pyrinomonadaceae bacterium]|nr:hypothetical protein [Pyrinomonadaceae bacterium]
MLILFVPVLFFCGCSSGTENSSRQIPLVADEKPAVPFLTSEPERFQAEIVVKTGDVEEKYRIARDGVRRRIDYSVDQPDGRATLITDREYLIDYKRKVFTAATQNPSAVENDDELVLHLLNHRDHTDFIDLGTENGLKKYQAKINDSDGSEVFLYIDPATNFPMKQEFFSVDGDARELLYLVELQNVTLEPDAALFELPSGFREVAISEFRKVLK